jgi:hypothetical protein
VLLQDETVISEGGDCVVVMMMLGVLVLLAVAAAVADVVVVGLCSLLFIRPLPFVLLLLLSIDKEDVECVNVLLSLGVLIILLLSLLLLWSSFDGEDINVLLVLVIIVVVVIVVVVGLVAVGLRSRRLLRFFSFIATNGATVTAAVWVGAFVLFLLGTITVLGLFSLVLLFVRYLLSIDAEGINTSLGAILLVSLFSCFW